MASASSRSPATARAPAGAAPTTAARRTAAAARKSASAQGRAENLWHAPENPGMFPGGMTNEPRENPPRRHFSMIRTFVLADFVTLLNGFSGAGAILSAMQYL